MTVRVESLGLEKRVGRKVPGVRLGQREFEILVFLLEMKMASLDQVYRKFFWSEASKSERYAYTRLKLLKDHGFVATQKVYTEPQEYFFATDKAYRISRNFYPSEEVSKALSSIDLRYFEHDKRVVDCCIALERSWGIRDWISERKLKGSFLRACPERLKSLLTAAFIPDAIFSMKEGTKVAFELEHARKVRERYEEKIHRFRLLMEERDPMLFSRTLFVATSQPVFQVLQDLTEAHGDLFKVIFYPDLCSPKPKEIGV